MWTGFLFIRDTWVPQPATCSSSIGKCSRRLGELAREMNVNENTHAAMTSGAAPDWTPQRKEPPCAEVVEMDEGWEDL